MKYIVSVLVNNPASGVYDYIADSKPPIGARVIVPFGTKDAHHIAVVYSHPKHPSTPHQLKNIIEVIDDSPVIAPCAFDVAQSLAKYYHNNLAPTFFDLMIPQLKSKNTKVLPKASPKASPKISLAPPHTKSPFRPTARPTAPFLNDDQKAAYSSIKSATSNTIGYNETVLFGVPGSGKTRVYLRRAADCIINNQQVLVLVPEISLVKGVASECDKVLSLLDLLDVIGGKPEIYHSKVSATKKRELAAKILDHQPLVVVGTRSAIHLPFVSLGMIVIDEEHDSGYKEDAGMNYNSKVVASHLAQAHNAQVLLVSATPSIESYYQALNKKKNIVYLRRAYKNIPFPKMEIIKGKNSSLLSSDQIKHIANNTHNNNQSMVYINSRGYAPRLHCMGCNISIECPQCSHALTIHQSINKLLCHLCGHKQAILSNCPACESPDLIALGSGTEKTYLLLKQEFPDAKIEQVDSDSIRLKDSWEKIQSKIVNGEVDIIIGTQLLSKGHNFPKVTYCVFLGADLALNSYDWNASVNIAAAIIQFAGRTMRSNKTKNDTVMDRPLPNTMISISTTMPDRPFWELILKGDYQSFLDYELKQRKKWGLPPYTKMAVWKIRAKQSYPMDKYIKQLELWVGHLNSEHVRGPVVAPIAKIKGQCRWNIMVVAEDYDRLGYWIEEVRIYLNKSDNSNIKYTLDIDPVSLN